MFLVGILLNIDSTNRDSKYVYAKNITCHCAPNTRSAHVTQPTQLDQSDHSHEYACKNFVESLLKTDPSQFRCELLSLGSELLNCPFKVEPDGRYL